MIDKEIAKAINRQINRELYSAYLYLGMASYAQAQGFKGIAHWFKIQVREESEHARKMYDYLQANGARVMMEAIEAPPQIFLSVNELFRKTLEHEKNVTKLINSLVDIAKRQNDKETQNFLQWFVKEQVEEEATPAGIQQRVDEAGKDKQVLLKIDSQLAARR